MFWDYHWAMDEKNCHDRKKHEPQGHEDQAFQCGSFLGEMTENAAQKQILKVVGGLGKWGGEHSDSVLKRHAEHH